jgi:hypothetical protein
VSELDPPAVSTLLLQRLGDITMFCCADRSTVCEEEPVVESIMLMKGAKNVVIVDTHADAVRLLRIACLESLFLYTVIAPMSPKSASRSYLSCVRGCCRVASLGCSLTVCFGSGTCPP